MGQVYALLILLILSHSHQSLAQSEGNIEDTPPLVIGQSPRTVHLKEGESLELYCAVTGLPRPKVKWTFDDREFDPSGSVGRIAAIDSQRLEQDISKLLFVRPIERDVGIYQCEAENNRGKALSDKVQLIKAFLDPFPLKQTRRYYPMIGSPLTLRCTPPARAPAGEIFWALQSSEWGSMIPVEYDARVFPDPEGNLNFVHVMSEDGPEGKTYVCIARNSVIRSIQKGERSIIDPQGQIPMAHPVSVLWVPPSNQMALGGTSWRLTCIFSGYPTPTVTWSRSDGQMPNNTIYRDHGNTMEVTGVEHGDAGNYECLGINDEITSPIRRSITLHVESAPHLLVTPESILANDGDNVTIHLNASGTPEPVYKWFINGMPVTQLPSNPRRIVQKDKITFIGLREEESFVVQCNITNIHGYIWPGIYLRVPAAQRPVVRSPLKALTKTAVGHDVELQCQVSGHPKPTVVWRKRGGLVGGDRFVVSDSGNLLITNATTEDGGEYECTASNIVNSASANRSLIVRAQTIITTAPRNHTILNLYEKIELRCEAITDVNETSNLVIKWKKDGRYLEDYKKGNMSPSIMFHHPLNNSLTSWSVGYKDSGTYTCVATNGVDMDEASAVVVVRGPPSLPDIEAILITPSRVRIIIRIYYREGEAIFSPVTSLNIQYKTDFYHGLWFDFEANISASSVCVETKNPNPFGRDSVYTECEKVYDLGYWCNYTFRVMSTNDLGTSAPSYPTSKIQISATELPHINPTGVASSGADPKTLLIYWQNILPTEQNGPEFAYLVSWRSQEETGAPTNTQIVYGVLAASLKVPVNGDAYESYEITVRSRNALGDCPVEPDKVTGYSGEDVPLVAPEGLLLDERSVTSSEAGISWTKPPTYDPDMMRGFFRGYRAELRMGDVILQNQDFIINNSMQVSGRISKRNVFAGSVTLTRLPQLSNISVQIRALNTYYAGPPSNGVYIQTRAGPPGPPFWVKIPDIGPFHVVVVWTDPEPPCGEIVGFTLSYQTLDGQILGQTVDVDGIMDVRNYTIWELEPDTSYRVSVAAVTAEGAGEMIYIDQKTAIKPPAAGNKTFVVWSTTTPTGENNGGLSKTNTYIVVAVCFVVGLIVLLLMVCLVRKRKSSNTYNIRGNANGAQFS